MNSEYMIVPVHSLSLERMSLLESNWLMEICRFLHNQVPTKIEACSLPASAMNVLRPNAHQCQWKICVPQSQISRVNAAPMDFSVDIQAKAKSVSSGPKITIVRAQPLSLERMTMIKSSSSGSNPKTER